jgi:hypothetical protein
MIFLQGPHSKIKGSQYIVMKESIRTYSIKFLNPKLQNFQQLVEYEQKVVRRRHKWEQELNSLIKQLYRLKMMGLLD